MRAASAQWLGRVVFVSLLLTGCADPHMDELDRDLEALRVDPGSVDLPPLVDVPTITRVTYDQADLRSPFMARRPEADAAPTGSAELAPDLSRPPEPLEAFVLESLELVGTLTVGGQQTALIRAPDGEVHRVSIGSYLGTDFGRIVSITARAVQLVEVVATGQGGWIERARQLTLGADQEQNIDRRG